LAETEVTRTSEETNPDEEPFVSRQELQLSTRNHGMPLEALRYDVTPAGLHYLLIHYDIPPADPATWRLSVGGRVERPIALTLDDLRQRPSVTMPVTMECAGNGRTLIEPHVVSQPWVLEAVGNAEWTGTPVWPLLEEAGIGDEAMDVVFSGMDRGVEGDIPQRYERALPPEELRRGEAILAWAMNGQPLLPQHGFPVRLVVPDWYGMTSVKWLSEIVALDAPFVGYQNVKGYRFRQDPDEEGVPVSRLAVRSLMVPPGIPEFQSRDRVVEAGPCHMEGRAWSGVGPVTRVEVSADGGQRWADATVEHASGRFGWSRWTFEWRAEPGEHVLCCRATDSEGRTQPLEASWNVGGYANNAVQRIVVNVS